MEAESMRRRLGPHVTLERGGHIFLGPHDNGWGSDAGGAFDRGRLGFGCFVFVAIGERVIVFREGARMGRIVYV